MVLSILHLQLITLKLIFITNLNFFPLLLLLSIILIPTLTPRFYSEINLMMLWFHQQRSEAVDRIARSSKIWLYDFSHKISPCPCIYAYNIKQIFMISYLNALIYSTYLNRQANPQNYLNLDFKIWDFIPYIADSLSYCWLFGYT